MAEAIETAEQQAKRWEQWHEARHMYRDPFQFVAEGMLVLGFSVAEVQLAIVEIWLTCGPRSIFMMQRGQAKTTVLSLLDLWAIIQEPWLRVAVFSGRGDLARGISGMIIQLSRAMPGLQCLMQTRTGVNESTTLFKVHGTLKGVDKTPSVYPASLQVGSQGERNDYAHGDDLETLANSASAVGRAKVRTFAEEITNQTMRRIYIAGTPQVVDSLYNHLAKREYQIFTIPGRFPTPTQRIIYGDRLAPWVDKKIASNPTLQFGGGVDGTQGRPVCPEYIGEEVLRLKEATQSRSSYLLQFMLNTSLIESVQAPLTWSRVILLNASAKYPIDIQPDPERSEVIESREQEYRFVLPAQIGTQQYSYPIKIVTSIDPALGGKVSQDRTAITTIAVMPGWFCIIGMRSVKGGYTPEILQAIAEAVAKHRPDNVIIEKNAGFGMFTEILSPVIRRIDPAVWQPVIEDEMVSGQKEARAIDTIEPVIGRSALCITRDAIKEHDDSLEDLSPEERAEHSFLFQLENITRAKGSLAHDDGIDSIGAAIRAARKHAIIDPQKEEERARNNANLEYIMRISNKKIVTNNSFQSIRKRARA